MSSSVAAVLALALVSTSTDAEPPLPEGLFDEAEEEPALPEGLDFEEESPTMPEDEPEEPSRWSWDVSGFAEIRPAARVVSDPDEDPLTLADLRAQLGAAVRHDVLEINAIADLIYDPVVGVSRPDLETGKGFLDLREANLVYSPFDFLDLKIGRQILTWGTGDLVFINDLFPKDYDAFFSGRDIEYLKAPSDAVKLTLAFSDVGLNVVYVPVFDADRIPDRERLSSWDPMSGAIVGEQSPANIDRPDEWFSDWEGALRLYGVLGPVELAAYAYTGFWKSPAGFDPSTAAATHPALVEYGGSVRGPILGGIAYLEGGYFDSRDDPDGTDPLIRDDEARGLVGFERELVTNVTANAQYYFAVPSEEETYHLLTARLRWQSEDERLVASFMTLVSPSEEDVHLRPKLTYRLDDHWRTDLGANLSFGSEDYTTFGQMKRNSNVFAAVRFSY